MRIAHPTGVNSCTHPISCRCGFCAYPWAPTPSSPATGLPHVLVIDGWGILKSSCHRTMNSILSTWSSFMNADGVRDRENKVVFAGKRSARGNTHAQELAVATIHFEQFTRATEELLLKCGAETRGSRTRSSS